MLNDNAEMLNAAAAADVDIIASICSPKLIRISTRLHSMGVVVAGALKCRIGNSRKIDHICYGKLTVRFKTLGTT